MDLKQLSWGVTQQGHSASKYILTNDNGMEVILSDFGALILGIRLPVAGAMRDVTLGFDTLEEYHHNPCFGAYVGRNGNRIANAKVVLDGVCYELEPNNNGNNLHSGTKRSYYEFYEAACGTEAEAVWIEFSRLSPHLEQGFPGNLTQKIRYSLNNANELGIQYHMVSDMTTVINPTNHSYFNLAGQGTVLNHKMTIYAEHFLPTDAGLIPTGELRSVADTAMDFRTARQVGERIDANYEPLILAGGYDHNYCFPNDGQMKIMAELESPDGLVAMTVASDLCGMQVYSGNSLKGISGKNGAVYTPRDGICFETQGYPNACNTPAFPSTVYGPGQAFSSKTVYKFTF